MTIRDLWSAEDPSLRPSAAAALATLQTAIPQRLDDLASDPDWRVGAAIARVRNPSRTPEAPKSPLPLLADRWGEARQAALARHGGDALTEKAVADALDWLARHQEEDGSWRCADHVPEHRRIRIPGFDREDDYVDAGVTGLAVLAFLGAGYTHQGTDAYALHVKHALDWFLRIQQPDGMIDLDPARKLDRTYHSPQSEMAAYNHAVPLLALIEAYGMTQDPALREPIERALTYSARTKDREHGWSISLRGDDIGPTIYYLMALPIAKAAGFTVTTEVENEALRYMTKITDLRRGQIRSLSPVPI
ncbi:MAG: terpene cyclase/mutase family protein [Planctomycetes bacterium]|nr:terpene cyclase/mutase family protein [Planctomycetota bacterium]